MVSRGFAVKAGVPGPGAALQAVGNGQGRFEEGDQAPGMLDAGDGEGAQGLAAGDPEGAEFFPQRFELEPGQLPQGQDLHPWPEIAAPDQNPPVGHGIKDLFPFQPGEKKMPHGQIQAGQNEGNGDPEQQGRPEGHLDFIADDLPVDGQQEQKDPEQRMAPVAEGKAARRRPPLPLENFSLLRKADQFIIAP